MRILLMNQFFWPDNAATSQLLTDLAQDLVQAGHHVEVICGGSYATTATITELEDVPAIVVHRVQGLRFSRSITGRVLSYATFYMGALWRAVRLKRPDVVLTLTTPPLLSITGALLKLLRKTRFCIWEMDVYPDVAVDLGYIRKGSLLDSVIGVVADWSRKRADVIITLGECMQERLVSRGIPAAKTAIVHNWADSSKISVAQQAENRKMLHIVYSGNLGLAHDVDTVIGAMRRLHGDPRFRFTFIGGGARRAHLASIVEQEGLDTVDLLPYVAREDLSQSLARGDIGLVTQQNSCCGSVVPSKVYGLLAAGRPILYVGPAKATPARIVQSYACGWCVAPGDQAGLTALLQHLAAHPEEVADAGRKARLVLESTFDRHLGTAGIMEQLVGAHTRAVAPVSLRTDFARASVEAPSPFSVNQS